MEWFKPHLKFRYPKYGEITYEDVVIEFRHALEPWHPLGEEPALRGVLFKISWIDRAQAGSGFALRELMNEVNFFPRPINIMTVSNAPVLHCR